MNKEFFKRYDNYRCANIPEQRIPVLLDSDSEENPSELDRVTKLIFTVGDDGLPVNELTLYLGDNCSPEISDFIRKNLLQQVSDSNVDTSGLSDDAIVALSRGVNESRSAYISRVNNYMRSQMSAVKARVARDKLFKNLEGHK